MRGESSAARQRVADARADQVRALDKALQRPWPAWAVCWFCDLGGVLSFCLPPFGLESRKSKHPWNKEALLKWSRRNPGAAGSPASPGKGTGRQGSRERQWVLCGWGGQWRQHGVISRFLLRTSLVRLTRRQPCRFCPEERSSSKRNQHRGWMGQKTWLRWVLCEAVKASWWGDPPPALPWPRLSAARHYCASKSYQLPGFRVLGRLEGSGRAGGGGGDGGISWDAVACCKPFVFSYTRWCSWKASQKSPVSCACVRPLSCLAPPLALVTWRP